MRILRLTLAGALALSAPMVAHAVPLGSNTGLAGTGPAPHFVQVWDSKGSGRHPAPGGVVGGWHPNPSHSKQWGGGWARPRWAPNGYYGLWGSPGAWGGPYTVWGGPYVPYRSYGDWGALWYPYAEWRGPSGGWGNP
jgi:hypothetical protein